MAALVDLVKFMDRELMTNVISDYPGAMNGLQLENCGEIKQIVAAVDASLRVVEDASQESGSLLIVHHGMFWQGARPITHAFYRKLKRAIDADMAIYSSHLPLDVHPTLGNNVCLARSLGFGELVPFFDHKGQKLGLLGDWVGTRTELVEKVENVVTRKVHLCPGGPERHLKVGIITGGAGGEIEKVALDGVDTLITGEGPHWSYPLAEELGVNLLYAGHYATETFGVKALADLLSRRFVIPWKFIDHPTGL